MKKTILSTALLAVFVTQAQGNGNGNRENQGQAQGQAQGQLQGQAQGQLQGQVATGGNAAASAIAGAAAGAIAGSISKTGASSSTSSANAAPVNASSSNTLSPTTTLTVNEAAAPEPLRETSVRIATSPTVYAPPAMTTAVCVIGVTAGGSGMGWGFALGSGLKDEGCEVRALSQLLHTYGAVAAAKELLCAHDPRVATAYAAAGQPCKAPVPVKTSDAGPPPRIVSPYLPG
jgi:hypothetical protein